jgi:hypothetical protein
METYIIKSTESKVIVAKIRTDGKRVQFILDNTKGELPKKAGDDFSKLQNFINQSSHLELQKDDLKNYSIIRYLLNNGDVVEVTNDLKTMFVNGTLLSDIEKQQLLNLLATNQLQVASQDGSSLPISVALKQVQENSTTNTEIRQKPRLNPTYLKYMLEYVRNQDRLDKMSNANYDYNIESQDYSDAEDPDFVKKMLYLFKYGDKKQ